MVAHTLRGSGFDASEDGTGRGTPLVAMPIEIDKSGGRAATVSPTLDRGSEKVGRNQVTPAVLQPMAFDDRQITDRHNRSNPQPDGPCHTLAAHNSGPALAFPARLSNQTISAADLSPTLEACNPTGTLTGERVRRLTTEECEALQGFPRGHTRIAWRGRAADDCPDGPRYRALGNSWPVPVVAWIGRRMARHMGQLDA